MMQMTVPLSAATSSSSTTYFPSCPRDDQRACVWYPASQIARFPATLAHLVGRYALRGPIELAVEQSADGFIVSDHETARFGDGLTLAEALESYVDSLIGYFKTLQTNRERLAPAAARHLQILERLIVEH